MTEVEELERELAALRQENSVLRNFVHTSKDALWSIEFLEPVDLTAPEPEIIRQVFENECVWRMCNAAMARLYKLPEDLDFNAQNVRFVFPRNPENEDFVRTLIDADFDMDGALSLDHDYDGREVMMENDVRARIEDGMMHRMMGAVRNISQKRARERALTDRLNTLSNVLSAIPDPVLVVDAAGVLQAANPALEWSFGWRLDDVLGQALDSVIEFPAGFVLSGDLPGPGEEGLRVKVRVSGPGGRIHAAQAYVSSFAGEEGAHRVVVALRNQGSAPAATQREAAEGLA